MFLVSSYLQLLNFWLENEFELFRKLNLGLFLNGGDYQSKVYIAEILGLNRSTLEARLHKLGIQKQNIFWHRNNLHTDSLISKSHLVYLSPKMNLCQKSRRDKLSPVANHHSSWNIKVEGHIWPKGWMQPSPTTSHSFWQFCLCYFFI